MKEFFLYASTLVVGAVLLGLLLYSFYIVLTSKDEKKAETGDQETPAAPAQTTKMGGSELPPVPSGKGHKKPRRAA
ncbi:MAG: hypothetical protein HUU32_04015 [Calditrichaceae bacterium]|nr:hypothetical protein [Calditrichia bacterium]NUQ40543.1 hypothetical protein [Calditrichaceae bacterium]